MALLPLLLLSRFSRVRLCATSYTAVHQAPPSLGFSRQEHWSVLPFPSPMRESESEVAQSCPTLRDPMDCSLPSSSMGFSRQEYWSGLPLPSPPGGASGKEFACVCRRRKRRRFNPWVGKIPWRKEWQPTPVLLPGEFQRQRSLAGYSPWGHEESD